MADCICAPYRLKLHQRMQNIHKMQLMLLSAYLLKCLNRDTQTIEEILKDDFIWGPQFDFVPNSAKIYTKYKHGFIWVLCLFKGTQKIADRARDVHFCRTFMWSISLFLDLAGYNYAQTLLNPFKVKWHCLCLVNVSVVLANSKKCSVHNRVVF